LKNNATSLFIMGVIIGGVIMLFIIALMNILDRSDPTAVLVPTGDNLPRLIALEPTAFVRK